MTLMESALTFFDLYYGMYYTFSIIIPILLGFGTTVITLRIPNSLLQPDIIIQTSEYIKKFLIISEEQLDNEDDDWNDD